MEQPDNPCASKIVAALNKVFKAEFTEAQIIWPDCVVHGGCYNVVLEADGLPVSVFNTIRPGRFRLSNWLYAWGVGGGNSLHLPRDG